MAAYDGLATESSPLPVPVILTETGGLQANTQRDWKIVPQMCTRSELYPQLSGQIAFQMLEEGAGYGLYAASANGSTIALRETSYGGASDLAKEFGNLQTLMDRTALPAASATPTPPTTAPTSFGTHPTVRVTWPDALLPPYKASETPNAAITVANYASCEIQVTQFDTVMGTVPSAAEQPTTQTMSVFSGVALAIQAQVSGTWEALCGVRGDFVKAPGVQPGFQAPPGY